MLGPREVSELAEDQDKLDAVRYRKLRDYLLSRGIIVHYKLSAAQSDPFVFEKGFTGETFEAAVDSLESSIPQKAR